MKRLTDRKFWDDRYNESTKSDEARSQPARTGIRAYFDRARIRLGAEPNDSYSGYLHNKVLLESLPSNSQWTALEVGCAPGHALMRLNRDFSYQPFGVEYSPDGVEISRRVFVEHGFDPEQVIEADFLSEEFLSNYERSFNIVLSGGFIEHFDDPKSVIKQHVRLLKEGGYLICTIPNLTSYAYPYIKLFAPEVIEAHNCTIMRPVPYKNLFKNLGLGEITCMNVGTFNLHGLTGMKSSQSKFVRLLARILDRISDLMDHLMFFTLRGHALETKWSPYLLYIGKRSTKYS